MAFLQEGEKIILEERAKSDFFGKGTLYLTNTRMVLEVNSGGLLFKKPEIKIDQPSGQSRRSFRQKDAAGPLRGQHGAYNAVSR